MKRIPLLALCLVTLASAVPGEAAVNVKASIKVPVAFAGMGPLNPGTGAAGCRPIDAGCHKAPIGRAHRCVYTTDASKAQGRSSGVLGYTVKVARTKTFTLASVPPNTADFDIAFYKKLGTCTGPVPVLGGESPDTTFKPTERYIFGSFGNGPEKGKVPGGAQFAIITLYGSADKTFSFSAK